MKKTSTKTKAPVKETPTQTISPFRPLETEYDKNSFHFRQVKREGLIAIYEQTDKENPEYVRYEVFEIIQKPEEYVGPQKYYQPARELVPSNTAWGHLAFTCFDMERAEIRFSQLQRQLESRLQK